ncbi:MAG: ATP-grasp domain-containing protein [Nitrospinae bacterium]|nr:ATP-grasp domain-containing protein [Nitrospinota bacterium]
MAGDFNILVTAASRRVAMIRGFKRAMSALGVSGQIQVTDSDRLSPGLRFADKFHIVPLSTSRDYIPTILDICRKEGIGMVVPTIDEELPAFGRRKKDFSDAGVIPLVCDEKVGRICTDKYNTSLFFSENGFPFAHTILPDQLDYSKVSYPLFIKPRMGRGSIGAHQVRNETELRFFVNYVKDPVVQNYLSGEEFTVDVLAGLDGRILSIVPRERIVIRSGVSDRGRTRNNSAIINLCKEICEKLKICGPVNMQCKSDNGNITFFEINPRFSGAIQLTVAAGADFFQMIIREALGERPEPAIGQFKDNFLMMSYEESLFEANGFKKISEQKAEPVLPGPSSTKP